MPSKRNHVSVQGQTPKHHLRIDENHLKPLSALFDSEQLSSCKQQDKERLTL
jgi:hypothetical protein